MTLYMGWKYSSSKYKLIFENGKHRWKKIPTPSQVPASMRLLTVASILSSLSSPDKKGFNLVCEEEWEYRIDIAMHNAHPTIESSSSS